MHMVKRVETLVQLNDELIELLDAEAARTGTSRSALIREAVASYLHDAREAAISRAIVEGYTRIPPGTPDGWGDLEALGDRATEELGQRLDEEEREGGSGSW